MSFITRKVEEKLGLDINGDGQIGGPGLTDKIEKATHIDLNRDGVIGVHHQKEGLVGKIEKATHIDINKDGYIGAPPVWHQAPNAHKKH